jgi:hypothetical protein
MLRKRGRCTDNLCRLFGVGAITCRCHAGAMPVPSRCNVGAILPKLCRNSVLHACYCNATGTALLNGRLKSEYGGHWMRRQVQSATPIAQSYLRAWNCALNRQALLRACGIDGGSRITRDGVDRNGKAQRGRSARPSCRHPCQALVRASDQPHRQPCLVASESTAVKRRSALARKNSLACCLNLPWRSVKPPRG